MRKKTSIGIVLLFFMMMLTGHFRTTAEVVYYVRMNSGGIEAFSSSLFATPVVRADGALQVESTTGSARIISAGEYYEWSTDAPSLPFLSSFKFNNKYNPALHQDIHAEGLGGELDAYIEQMDTINFTLNAIGKSLTPSFKVSEPDAVVYAEGKIAESKVSRYRFDHDIVFTVTRPDYIQWTVDDKGKLVNAPFGHSYLVHVNWLTDNPENVPRIDINIEGGKTVTSKEVYLKASFSIQGYGVYEDFLSTDVWIKGRGNTSWGWPKKPYRLKFDEKVHPFGLTGGKSWVLLSNYLEGSLFTNALAFKIGQLAGTAACNHAIPVELYINGKYQGSYIFTEKIGFGNNSLDADDTEDCLLELSREYDEPYRFRSVPYNLPVNIKEPDFSVWATTDRDERMGLIEEDFNRLARSISRQADEVTDLLDFDACARFLLVNDLSNNVEINHPKSTFIFKEDVKSNNTKYIFGPVWDFDWAWGFARTNTYFDTDQQSAWLRQLDGSSGNVFFGDLMNLGVMKRYYYKVWMDYLDKGCIEELKEFLQDYYDFTHVSFEHDSKLWGQWTSYEGLVKKAQKWLNVRADYIVRHLDTYDLSDFESRLEGDVNKDGDVTVTDAVLTFDYIRTGFSNGMDLALADVNYDGSIDLGDVVSIVRRIMKWANEASPIRPYGFHNPSAQLVAQPFEVDIDGNIDVPIQLVCDSMATEPYHALQCDICLPEGLRITALKSDCERFGYQVTAYLENDKARVVLMPSGDVSAPLQELSSVLVLTVAAEKVVNPSCSTISLTNIHITTHERDEEQLHSASIRFTQTTGLNEMQSKSIHVSSGHSIVITSLVERDVTVISVDGKCITTCHVQPGRNTFMLPKGVYIIEGEKAIVY
ncbi:MAG: CotH kinase family protein [Bacteroidaceae bacterium]|nr:CotH kinase family protein [Bacteroidaceae bacterium]